MHLGDAKKSVMQKYDGALQVCFVSIVYLLNKRTFRLQIARVSLLKGKQIEQQKKRW